MTSSNVVNPWKIFHSSSSGSPSILSKVLYSGEFEDHVSLFSHAQFDCGFSFMFPRHNTESVNTTLPDTEIHEQMTMTNGYVKVCTTTSTLSTTVRPLWTIT